MGGGGGVLSPPRKQGPHLNWKSRLTAVVWKKDRKKKAESTTKNQAGPLWWGLSTLEGRGRAKQIKKGELREAPTIWSSSLVRTGKLRRRWETLNTGGFPALAGRVGVLFLLTRLQKGKGRGGKAHGFKEYSSRDFTSQKLSGGNYSRTTIKPRLTGE